MSRYLGPRLRQMRALGVDLPGLSRKTIERRPYPPGQHGPSPKRRKNPSPFKERLMEKQKLRFYYGLTERQFGNVVELAGKKFGNTGELLIALLETRLDNVVFRGGIARTIPAARQLVNHGHLRVDGKLVDRPGFHVRVGQRITLRESSRELDVIVTSLVDPVAPPPPWLDVDPVARSVGVVGVPDSSSLLVSIDLRLVVEFYAQ